MPPLTKAPGGAIIKLINRINNTLINSRFFGWNGLTLEVALLKVWPLLSKLPAVVRYAQAEYIAAGYPRQFVARIPVKELGDIQGNWCWMYEIKQESDSCEDIYSDAFWRYEPELTMEEIREMEGESVDRAIEAYNSEGGDYDPFGEDDLNKIPVSFWVLNPCAHCGAITSLTGDTRNRGNVPCCSIECFEKLDR